MHGYDFPPKRGTAEADACFGEKARRHKPSNPYMHGNAEAELWRSGKARTESPQLLQTFHDLFRPEAALRDRLLSARSGRS
ncbi:hypothetical protein FML28_25240 [Klebsiella grimontii]|nr:hypothetical protein [Klebsiella grimontii]